MKKIYLLIILVVAVVAAVGWEVTKSSKTKPMSQVSRGENSIKLKTSKQSFNKNTYSTDTPGSIWWIVNKKRPLPSGYVPPNLVVPNVPLRLDKSSDQMHVSSQVQSAVEQLFTGAKSAGYTLLLLSGYRSVAYQKQIYDSYVAKDGQAAADRYSARPGTSEHQTGLAMDVGRSDRKCEVDQCFADTDEGKWLAQNAHNYGFVVRYPKDKESVTGYEYEPWHIRYVGIPLATEVYNQQTTLEEFFGLN